MQDELDRALRRLPSAAYPAGLTQNIILQVQKRRRFTRIVHRIGWAGAVSGAAAGIWLLMDHIGEGTDVVPAFSIGSAVRWFGALGSSPSRTVIDSTLSIWDWGQMLLIQFGWVSVVGLALLLLSSLWVLGRLLFEQERDDLLWA